MYQFVYARTFKKGENIICSLYIFPKCEIQGQLVHKSTETYQTNAVYMHFKEINF